MTKSKAAAAAELLQACSEIDSIATEVDNPRLAELLRTIAHAADGVVTLPN
jgi:hypothetical protein